MNHMRVLIRTALEVSNQLRMAGLERIALLAVQRVADRGLDFWCLGKDLQENHTSAATLAAQRHKW